MKKSNFPYKKHALHNCDIAQSIHHNGYYYRCLDCDIFVGWLSKLEVKQLEQSLIKESTNILK